MGSDRSQSPRARLPMTKARRGRARGRTVATLSRCSHLSSDAGTRSPQDSRGRAAPSKLPPPSPADSLPRHLHFAAARERCVLRASKMRNRRYGARAILGPVNLSRHRAPPFFDNIDRLCKPSEFWDLRSCVPNLIRAARSSIRQRAQPSHGRAFCAARDEAGKMRAVAQTGKALPLPTASLRPPARPHFLISSFSAIATGKGERRRGAAPTRALQPAIPQGVCNASRLRSIGDDT